MNKHASYIIYALAVIIGILSIATYSLYSRLNNLNESISKLHIINNKDLSQVNNLIFESHFKDDLVLSNFNNSITIIIAFFTVLIALGAVFSFKRIDDEIKELKTTTNEINETKKEIEKTALKITTIETNLNNVNTRYQIKILVDKQLNFQTNLASITSRKSEITVNNNNFKQIYFEHIKFIRNSREFINELEFCLQEKYMSSFFEARETNLFTIEKFDTQFKNGIFWWIKNIKINNLDNENINYLITKLQSSININRKDSHKILELYIKELIEFYESHINQNTH